MFTIRKSLNSCYTAMRHEYGETQHTQGSEKRYRTMPPMHRASPKNEAKRGYHVKWTGEEKEHNKIKSQSLWWASFPTEQATVWIHESVLPRIEKECGTRLHHLCTGQYLSIQKEITQIPAGLVHPENTKLTKIARLTY